MIDLRQLVKDRRRGLITDTAIAQADVSLSWSAAASKALIRSNPEQALRGRQALLKALQTWAKEPPEPEVRPTEYAAHPFQGGEKGRDQAGEYYLDGEMRHTTRVQGAKPSAAPTFAISDILGNHAEISLIIAASYNLDMDWIATVFPDPELVPTVLVSSGEDDNEETAEECGATMPETWRRHMVLLEPTNCYGQRKSHMKWILVRYKTGRLRVAIMTADLHPYSWSQVENTIFIQDFLLSGCSSLPHNDGSPSADFPRQFQSLFKTICIDKAFDVLKSKHPQRAELQRMEGGFGGMFALYSWELVRCRVVTSVAGHHVKPSEQKKYGLGRLVHVLEKEGLIPSEDERVVVEYNTAVLGQYRRAWLARFFSACEGSQTTIAESKEHPLALSIVYPAVSTVRRTVSEEDQIHYMQGGGNGFTRGTCDLFYDRESKRGPLAAGQSTVIAAVIEQKESYGGDDSVLRKRGSPSARGWVYIGSHNLSGSAWGWDEKQAARKKKNHGTVISAMNNYELGVIMPLDHKNAIAEINTIVPWKRPVRAYAMSDEAWDPVKHTPPW